MLNGVMPVKPTKFARLRGRFLYKYNKLYSKLCQCNFMNSFIFFTGWDRCPIITLKSVTFANTTPVFLVTKRMVWMPPDRLK